MAAKWPRRLLNHDTHYLVHKVSAAFVGDDGRLHFTYEDECGCEVIGPFYPSLINAQKPLADRVMRENSIEKPADIGYLVAYH